MIGSYNHGAGLTGRMRMDVGRTTSPSTYAGSSCCGTGRASSPAAVISPPAPVSRITWCTAPTAGHQPGQPQAVLPLAPPRGPPPAGLAPHRPPRRHQRGQKPRREDHPQPQPPGHARVTTPGRTDRSDLHPSRPSDLHLFDQELGLSRILPDLSRTGRTIAHTGPTTRRRLPLHSRDGHETGICRQH
jgi:hypothetical protein